MLTRLTIHVLKKLTPNGQTMLIRADPAGRCSNMVLPILAECLLFSVIDLGPYVSVLDQMNKSTL
jgi:hypothetical protein